MIATNVRHPRDFRGDLAAMIGSARVGERRLQALLGEYGVEPDAGGRGGGAGLRRAPDARLHRRVEGRRLPRRGRPRRRRPRATRHLRSAPVVTKRGRRSPWTSATSHPQVTAFVNSSYANMRVGRRHGARVPDRSRHPEERRDVPAAHGDRARGHRRVGQGAGAGDALHQPLRAGDRRGGHQGARGRLSRACDGGLGAAVPHRRPGTDPEDGPAVHLAHVPGAARRRRVVGRRRLAHRRRVAGRGRHQVRQHRGHRGALPAVLPPPRVPARLGRGGRYRGGVGAALEFVVETAEPARANTAGDGVRHGACGMAGGATGTPHHYRLVTGGGTSSRGRGGPRRERVLRTKEVGVEVAPGAVFLVESGGGGGWGDPRKRTAAERAADVENEVVTGRSPVTRKRSARRRPAG